MKVWELIEALSEIEDKEQYVILQVSTMTYGMESQDIEDITERIKGGVVISGSMTGDYY